MKINVNDAYRIYAKNSAPTPQPQEAKLRERKASSGNVDTVTISSSALRRSEIDKLASSLSLQAEGEVSPARIEGLRQAVQNGSYRIETGQLAEAIFHALI